MMRRRRIDALQPRSVARAARLALAAMLAVCGDPAAASDPDAELRIITSYEPEVVEPFLAAFLAQHPGVTVRDLNKNTHAAVDEILSGNERRFDLFWASAPEAFEVLDAADRLRDVGFGRQVDFAYSAVGWAWMPPAVGAPPLGWNDLLAPDFAGRIAMSHPKRSGTTQSLIETVIQDRGWHAGWAWLLELAGQLNTITARSFGVLEGLEQGLFDIGLTIDFLALKRADRGMVFRYGRPILIVPARIAALKGGQRPHLAQAFIGFVGSPEGQRLLLRHDIRRIPADPAIRAELAETLLPEVRAALRFSWSRYDPVLASSRYWEVGALFEAFVARDFLRRRDLWRRLRALAVADAAPTAALRRLLRAMPVSEHQAAVAARTGATQLAWAAEATAILDRVEAGIAALERNGGGR
jgi:ABC-type Fe3+ transport system substrate-binding protein